MKRFLYLSCLITLGILTSQCESQKPCIPVVTELHSPEWTKNLSIYELNIRQFSQEGTFKAVEHRLDELKKMNVGIIWLMPINPIGEKNRKGSLGSYYAVKDYFDVNPEFGTKKDFKDLVDAIHAKGMFVIVDWVANHTAWDNVLVETNPEFYTKNKKGEFVPPVEDWSDVIDLNYENKELWAYKIKALKYWVSDFDIDGYRCDVASMVPTPFWDAARVALDSLKPVFMLAEAEMEEHHVKAFDMSYGWEMHHYFNEIAKGNKSAKDLVALINQEECRFPKQAYRMRFVDNHDENSWNGTMQERLGDATNALIVLSATLPGMPLLYSGDEAGMDKRLAFFEKDPIEWKDHPNRALFTTLFKLKKDNEALFNGAFGGDFEIIQTNNESVLAFKRIKDANNVLVVINLSKENQKEVFGNEWFGTTTYYSVFGGYKTKMNAGLEVNLAPWEYHIWTN